MGNDYSHARSLLAIGIVLKKSEIYIRKKANESRPPDSLDNDVVHKGFGLHAIVICQVNEVLDRSSRSSL